MLDEFWTTTLTVLHVLAAGTVSIHVLLSHREVRSTIGWMGLSWLSPFVGSALYFVLGVNRVARRAARLDRRESASHIAGQQPKVPATPLSVEPAPIRRLSDRITDLPLLAGNRIDSFETGEDAFAAMLAAINEAKSSIAMSAYIFKADKTGSAFIAALAAAERRGVMVRVQIDGMGSGYIFCEAAARLHAAGVPMARFHHEWAPWKMSFINLRNHKKHLIVDGRVGFTGGMNIGDHHLSSAGRKHVRDVHFRLEGPIVGQMMRDFSTDWHFASGEELAGEAWFPELEEKGDIPARSISSGPDETVESIEMVVAGAIEAAQHRVRIVTPYFLPEDWLLGVLRRAAYRGVEVELIIPERTNHFYFDWAVRGHLSRFRPQQVMVYLSPMPFDHAKLMSVDGQWCTFGSSNWDERSFRLNFEYNVECYDQNFTRKLDDIIDARLAKAKVLQIDDLDRRPLYARLRDAVARLLLVYL